MKNRSPITSHLNSWDFLQPAFDAVAIFGALFIVKWTDHRYFDDAAVSMGLIAVVVFLLASTLTGLQRRASVENVNREVICVLGTWAATVLVLALLAFVTRYGQFFARSLMLAWIVLAPSLIGLFRMIARIVQQTLLSRGIGVRRVGIAGLNDLGRQTSANIGENSSLGLQVVGFYDDRTKPRDLTDSSGDPDQEDDDQLVGDLTELVSAARQGSIDMILVTLPMRAEKRIRFLLDELSDSTVSVYIVPDFFVFELLHSRWTSLGGLPAVSVIENPLFGIDGVSKRIADFGIATAALVVAALPMLLIAAGIKLTSKGPVFFRQKRYGLDGREILVWKFRSMRSCDNGAVVKQATKGDPRITKLGGILRKTSLDEIPQLFNVIEGSMSLVGPRPHASAHNEQYRGQIRGYMLRHKVKPGITGLAQVNGCRGETETIDKMQKRVDYDHQYIRTWSLWLDLKIVFKTLLVVWKQPEAY